MRRRWLAFFIPVALAACRAPTPSRHLILATTTSVANSGLLEVLLDDFQRQYGIQVRSHLVGSGLALRMLETGEADVVLSHAPDAEATALKRHPTWRYRKFMYNDFVLVGPLADPAGVKGAVSAEDAMRRIAASNAKFLSRGDGSGTHEREEELWRRAAERPSKDRLIVAGAGMGTTLRIASETGAYTLTDRATLTQHAHTLRLAIVFQDDPGLLNTYAVVFDPADPRSRDAQVFLEWVCTGRGRRVIESYRIRQTPVFYVWPEAVAGGDPRAVPRPP